VSHDLAVVGVPTSAGAHHAGQDLTPAALRAAGLVERLAAAGVRVHDVGDLAGSVWVADRPDAGARNLEAVTQVAADVADAVEWERAAGRVVLVVGGDCTITLGVVAGLQRAGSVALAYVDGDADLNPPDRGSGVLDATGVAHLLGLVDDSLSRLGPRFPMLGESELALLGYDPDDVDSVDLDALAARPGLRHATYSELSADPAGLAARARDELLGDAMVVHFDVDVVDGRELPLANFPHYCTGVSVETVRTVLATLLRSDRLAAVVLTEVNPTHDPSGALLERYVELVVDVLREATTLG
jgi:arginase